MTSWIKALFFAIMLALLIRAFVIEPVRVDGPSMNDTLATGQRLVVFKTSYLLGQPARGDIVVLEMNTDEKASWIPFIGRKQSELDYIKRIIGVPGDVIDLQNGQVIRNGERLQETYAKGLTYPSKISFPLTVPDGRYFVLGDNRTNSSDSRYFDCIEQHRVRGKAVFRFYPFDVIGIIK